ncbi:MAG: hypothetical protein H0V65_04185 [Chitinophagales bacterium]|nr:hypothetical protein [Chitinophagales bacterium]
MLHNLFPCLRDAVRQEFSEVTDNAGIEFLTCCKTQNIGKPYSCGSSMFAYIK